MHSDSFGIPERDALQGALFEEARTSGNRDRKNGKHLSVKNYVLDTNVLLHDPHSVYRFADNHVWIPLEVLTELDRFKNEQSERGANARSIHRFLGSSFKENPRNVISGAKAPGGGLIRIAVEDYLGTKKPSAALQRFLRMFPDMTRTDHRILACCLSIADREESPTILVTKDLNMQLKALAIGMEAQDYLSDKVAAKDVESYDLRTIEIAAHDLQRFGSSRQLELPANQTRDLHANEYVILYADERRTMPARYIADGCFQRLNVPAALPIPRGIDFKPLNVGQQCFLDALLDPDIALITCYGKAGTGKTLAAVAAGLAQVFTHQFNGLTVSRPVVAMGETLGFLPGDLNEKMRPWLQSIYDAFEVLLPMNPPAKDGKAGRRNAKKPVAEPPPQHMHHSTAAPMKPYEQLIERGLVEIEALCYIRGRSIPNRFFVLDEAQQLTPLEAKTVVTRMSRGSKLVMVGDPAQIDNPYVDSHSNGLVYTRNKLKGQGITAHISLTKGERSPLAELGASSM